MKKVIITFCILSLNFIFIPQSYAEAVFYNTKTHKYHNFSCRYAKKCTVNCIKLDKKVAKKRGGIPCKVCGG